MTWILLFSFALISCKQPNSIEQKETLETPSDTVYITVSDTELIDSLKQELAFSQKKARHNLRRKNFYKAKYNEAEETLDRNRIVTHQIISLYKEILTDELTFLDTVPNAKAERKFSIEILTFLTQDLNSEGI